MRSMARSPALPLSSPGASYPTRQRTDSPQQEPSEGPGNFSRPFRVCALRCYIHRSPGLARHYRKCIRAQAAKSESLELVLDLKGKLLESPVWDGRLQKLIFVDTDGQRIYKYDPSTPDSLISVHLPEPVGFVGLTEVPDQVLLAALASDVAITPEEHGADGHRFNDGKPGPAGVCIFGRKHESSETPDGQRGRVYRLDMGPSVIRGKLTEVMTPEETQLPNGMGWDMQKGVMYLNDTFMKEFEDTPGIIWEIQVDKQGVPARNASKQLKKRVVYKINVAKEGGPDGMTLDSQGRIWLALAKGSKLICVDPTSNTEVHRINMPIQMPTACAFGGKNLDELYITSTELGGGKGAGGLWRYTLEGLKGLSAAHVATIQSS
ncbi:hypothetical protein WJX74_001465 [Apatococcus lobatus]|uniref:SMP-30/Gluconolactonase/LRE-like region domain-containing protein n=2 Tax=Apatococcus TaxID=904362 RepID=A0AAW1TAI9_9CHLO